MTKPLDATEVLRASGTLLETPIFAFAAAEPEPAVGRECAEQTQELEQARIEILQRLAMAAEYREDPTGEHPKRVGETAANLARAAGLPKAQIELIRQAAALHDVGKIRVPDAILKKTSTLTAEEYEQVKLHASIGARILSGTQVPLLQLAEEIALYHHEHWDGAGYASIKGQDIPVSARIVAASRRHIRRLTSHDRPHREASVDGRCTFSAEKYPSKVPAGFDPRLARKHSCGGTSARISPERCAKRSSPARAGANWQNVADRTHFTTTFRVSGAGRSSARAVAARPPSAESVHEQLNRIVSSRTFTRSKDLCRFLRFIVEQTYAPTAPCAARECLIGVTVFRRRREFSIPALDPIVARCRACRLRSKLDLYYETEGWKDTLRMVLPSSGRHGHPLPALAFAGFRAERSTWNGHLSTPPAPPPPMRPCPL